MVRRNLEDTLHYKDSLIDTDHVQLLFRQDETRVSAVG